jgi:drug/metabolite transporter (DMT)-like permease
MESERDGIRFYVAMCIAVVSISCAAIFFRKAQPTPPLTMAGVRLALAALVLWPVAFWRTRGRRVSGRVWIYGAVCGLLYGLHFGTWVTSLMLTSVASSVTLVTATPLILGIHAALTGRDRPNARFWWSMGIAFIGLLLIGSADFDAGGSALVGDTLALTGAAAMAVYLLISRRLGTEMHLWCFTATATTVGAVLMLTMAGALGQPVLPTSSESWLWIAAAALIPHLIGHTLLTWSVQYATPTTVGLATLGEPVGAALLGWFVLGEGISAMVGFGCALTLIAVALALRR